ADTTALWAGSGLSLFWLGLVCCVVVALDGLGRASAALGTVSVATILLLAVPSLIAAYPGATSIGPTKGRIVPAVVAAEPAPSRQLGTRVFVPASASEKGGVDRLSVVLHRGYGTPRDGQSACAAADQQLSETDDRLATLAGNLGCRSG